MLSKILVISCVFLIPIVLCQRPGSYQAGGNGYDGYSSSSGGLKYLGQSCASREQCSTNACMDGKCCYHEGLNCGVQNKLANNPCCPDLTCYEGTCVPRFVVSSQTRDASPKDTLYEI